MDATRKPSSPAGKRSRLAALAAGVVLLAAGAWGVSAWVRSDSKDDSDLPASLTREALASVDDPGVMRHTVREVMRRDDLTDEQRRRIMENLRDLRQQEMRQRVDAYFAADDAEKDAVLDEHIDEWMARLKAWHEAREKEDQEEQFDPAEMRRRFGSQSRQERKERSEARNPDEMARTIQYFSAVRNRMQERGLQMPSFRGRGPRGGGPAPRGRP